MHTDYLTILKHSFHIIIIQESLLNNVNEHNYNIIMSLLLISAMVYQ